MQYMEQNMMHVFLAADVEVVVFGVTKNVSSYQIATYAEKRGIKI